MTEHVLVPGRVRELREAAGEDQVDLAVAIGRSRTYVSKLETGDVNPSIETLIAIAHHYRTSPNYLLGWSTREPGAHGEDVAEDADKRTLLTLFERIPPEDRAIVEAFLKRLSNGALGSAVRKGDEAA